MTYPIDYGAITPKGEDCCNLLVPVCLSATHAAYGSMRMEPVFMMLGEASAVAVTLALEDDADVQAVDPERVSRAIGNEGE